MSVSKNSYEAINALRQAHGEIHTHQMMENLAELTKTEQAIDALGNVGIAVSSHPMDVLLDIIVTTSDMKNVDVGDLLIDAFGFDMAQKLSPIFFKDKLYFQRAKFKQKREDKL